MKKVSVIITARNNAQFLHEAIQSVFSQSVAPFEVIYSDDFSTDNSLQVAAKFDGLIIIAHKKHVGVVQARNDGADKSRGNILVFLDGDDVMPTDYLARHLEVFTEKTPFVYGAAQAFGTCHHFWHVRPWKEQFLWNRNFVNTSAMMWKDAFIKVGKWKETCEFTMWDWSLALRLSRLGTPAKSSAILLYRQHDQSWSHSKEKSEGQLLQHSNTIRKELVTLTVGLIYSGRIPGFLQNWMQSLITDIQIIQNKPDLIIINNSETDISSLYTEYQNYFSNIRIITGVPPISYQSEVERRSKICELLSDQYNRIIELSNTELIHLREDDIIPNAGSFALIFNFITSGNNVPNAVAGVYLNRNVNYRRLIGGFYDTENPVKTADLTYLQTQDPFQIDFTGTGFLIFWKDLCPTFEPYIDRIQAHDWAWGMKLKRNGGRLWMIPKAICKHHIDATEYVEYSPSMEINKLNTFTKPANQKPKANKYSRTKTVIYK